MPENAKQMSSARNEDGTKELLDTPPAVPAPSYPKVMPTFGGRAATAQEFEGILGALRTDGQG
jgi:hypothetical protein